MAAAMGIFYRGLVGSLVATLFYGIILKPLLEKLSADPKYTDDSRIDAVEKLFYN